MTEKSVLSVQELARQMGISLPKAYELVKEPGFPTIRIGTRILIPTEDFHSDTIRVERDESGSRRENQRKEEKICLRPRTLQ